jgi:methylated-DNA-protein-cysteine methyltransferase-like protein
MATETKRGAGGWQSVYRVVRRIPPGRVATYGQIAALSGMPGAARQVGWALHALTDEDDVPWQRVINARGEISARGVREIEDLQRALLRSEGVEFNRAGRVDLAAYAWQPRMRTGASKAAHGKSAQKKKSARARSGNRRVQRKQGTTK